jgi:hypothetical protein
MTRAQGAIAAIVAALAATGGLIGLEVHRGALDHGRTEVADPCDRRSEPIREGFDAAAQRVARAALDAAACDLGMGREELLIALAGSLTGSADLPAGAEPALRDGLEEAIQAERDAGRIDRVSAFLLRQAAQHTPASWIVTVARELVTP